jgi:hypothetical protein
MMIEEIKNIKECLVLSNKATNSLNSTLKHMQDKFLVLDNSFSNKFSLQRTAINHLASHIANDVYHNERLQYIATKFIENPELLDEEISVKLIDDLSMVDASLQDGKYGRPVEGILFPEVASQVIEILENKPSNSRLESWQDWRKFVQAYQSTLKQLIVLFPIQYLVSSHLYTLHYGLKEIAKEIIEQCKLEYTIDVLSAKCDNAYLNKHSSYFRLHIRRLQREQITAPMISESKYQQELDDSKVIYQISPNEENSSGIFGMIKNQFDQYFLKKIQPVGEFDFETFYNFNKHWNLTYEEEE